MFNTTMLVTFSGTPIHAEMQKSFHEKYDKYFYGSIQYNMDWLKTRDFYKENIDIFKYEKYAGFFLWKPYIITEAMKFGQPVLYCDANIVFKDITRLETLFKNALAQNKIFLIKHRNYINMDWTKRDAFVLMDADTDKYWNAKQLWSVCMGFDKNHLCKSLLKEYLYYCSNPDIITESPNKLVDNFSTFREHRWEQSVISILAEKYNINCVWDSDVPIDKYYTPELNIYKLQINKNPMQRVGDEPV